MAKISELGRITGVNTRSGDLFVTVSLDQGINGTKNITRRELVQAIQGEAFDNITITGGSISNLPINNVVISDSQLNNSTINAGLINNTELNYTNPYTPDLEDSSYFVIKDVINNETVRLTYADLQDELAKTFSKSQKIYVDPNAEPGGVGSYLQPFGSLEDAFDYMNQNATFATPISLSVMPGDYYTNGNLSLPDRCTVVSTNGQYATNIIMNAGFEKENCILVGSGCYVQGFSFVNLEVDNFDNPTKGFAISFRPNATILRSPYIRDCSQISNYRADTIGAPLRPINTKGTLADLGNRIVLSDVVGNIEVEDVVTGVSSNTSGIVSRNEELGDEDTIYIRNIEGNFEIGETLSFLSGGTATLVEVGEEDFPNPYVGRGGGMLLADRSVLNQNSIFPYMLAFGATPRSPNGIGYVAKNGAGINGISSLSIFVRCAFYSLNGGQITLNNSGTQFGDVSMRAKGFTPVVNPYATSVPLVLSDTTNGTNLGNKILDNAQAIIDYMWDELVDAGYTVSETFTRRDAGNWLRALGFDFLNNSQNLSRNFVAGLFDYRAQWVFPIVKNPGSAPIRTVINTLASTALLPLTNNKQGDTYVVYSDPSNKWGGNIYVWVIDEWVNYGANDPTLLNAFLESFDFMSDYIKDTFTPNLAEINMLDGIVNDVTKQTIIDPRRLQFGSLIESLAHQFNLAGAGVNKNALPLNFRRVATQRSAIRSILQEDGGRIRFSGADELNNQFFAKGLRINGQTGRLEGRPFTSSVRRLARRAANSRVST
jgi:hypothetical protein